jgi:hypothetical protein
MKFVVSSSRRAPREKEISAGAHTDVYADAYLHKLSAVAEDIRRDLQTVHESLRDQVAASHDSISAKIEASERRIRQRMDSKTNTLILVSLATIILANLPAVIRVLTTMAVVSGVCVLALNERAYRWVARSMLGSHR